MLLVNLIWKYLYEMSFACSTIKNLISGGIEYAEVTTSIQSHMDVTKAFRIEVDLYKDRPHVLSYLL